MLFFWYKYHLDISITLLVSIFRKVSRSAVAINHRSVWVSGLAEIGKALSRNIIISYLTRMPEIHTLCLDLEAVNDLHPTVK